MPREVRQDPGGLHPVLAALGVDGEQRELPRRGGVDPGELPRGAEPGLVEVDDLAGDQVPGDRGQRGREEARGLPRGRGERAGRGRAAEQVRQCLAGAVPRQELAVPQVDPGAHDPVPVLDRRGHAVRGLRLRLAAAAALHRQHLVLGRHRLHRRDVDDLPPLDRGDRRVPQGLPAAAALRRPVPHLLVRVLRQLHRGAGLALRPARLAAGLAAQRLRRRLRRPVRRRRLRLEFREFVFTCAARSATCDCSAATSLAQRRVLRGLLLDPGVPLGQQLPQPRVRSAKPAITAVGNAGHLGHGRTLPRLRPARK